MWTLVLKEQEIDEDQDEYQDDDYGLEFEECDDMSEVLEKDFFED